MHDNHLKCGYSVNVKLGLQIENHQDFVWTEPICYFSEWVCWGPFSWCDTDSSWTIIY